MKVICFLFMYFYADSDSAQDDGVNQLTNLVQSNPWYIAGPVLEDENMINTVRIRDGIIRVTANNQPVGEIELNVMISPSASNDGPPTKLSDQSSYVEITYKSSHAIKLQAREGNEMSTACVHGGSHPRVDLPVSGDKFLTLRIPWSKFRQDGKPDGKPLNSGNICKFNFVNYDPMPGATLEIRSVVIENF